MPSIHFVNLVESIEELKRIYLVDGLAAAIPSDEQQERARAFVVLAHAEMEYFVEEVLRDLAKTVLQQATAGYYGRSALALLTFGGLDQQNGGTALSKGKKKLPRVLTTRIGDASANLQKALDANTGVKEKYLAEMAIPLGLDPDEVDDSWLAELEAFCVARGAFAHMSRKAQGASHLAVDPKEMWRKTKRIVWTDTAFVSAGTISSFERFDDWAEAEKRSFGVTVKVADQSKSVLSLLRRLVGA
ncbi:HEPN domain-containing protein [Ralstonia wenshanensis]|uniref:HEPN domain-containing protein n=1 Tax=Ralstonia wenshanensis TaxID=2842456 RepID=UPI003D96992C